MTQSTPSGRIAMVTGSASGIGLAITELLRARGHRVIGVDLRDAEVIADLATDEGRTAMVEQVGQLAGDRLDVVIANAGVTHPDALCYQVNYRGAVATLAGLRPLLARSQAPRAVVTASFAAASGADLVKVAALESGHDPDQGGDFGGGYIVSKYAIAHWVRVNAPRPEWAGAGILLNAVCPGLIETPMQQQAARQESVQQLMRAIPIRRTAQPQEMAELFAFLASPANSYVTGQLIYADGGLDAMIRGTQI